MHKGASAPYRGRLLDIDTSTVRENRPLLQSTAIGFLCASLGEQPIHRSSSVFRGSDARQYAKQVLNALQNDSVEARRLGVPRTLAKAKDNHLRGLAIAEALAKAGFDPDEPRDERGRWTSSGDDSNRPASPPSVPVAASFLAPSATFFAEDTAASTLASLAKFLARLSAPTVVFQILFISSNRSLVSEGTVENRPDIAFRYDQGTGVLDITQNGALRYSGRVDADGLFRYEDGTPLARNVGASVILDTDALPDPLPAGTLKENPGADSRAEPQTDAKDDEPKLCPDPSPDRPGSNRSPEGVRYQAFINKLVNPDNPLPPGLAVALNKPDGDPVVYDDCYRRTGVMVEAKGYGYLSMLKKGVDKYPWVGVLEVFLKQARNQLAAAGDRPVEWHFAEKEIADRARTLFKENDLPISVYWTPPPWKN